MIQQYHCKEKLDPLLEFLRVNKKSTVCSQQVVWKSTRQLGVGIATIKRGFWTKTYVVARYTPPGNYWGRFKQEVGDITVL